MRAPKALLLWDPSERLLRFLEMRLGDDASLVCREEREDRELLEEAADAVAMVGWRISADLLDASPALRLFQTPGAGVRHLLETFAGRDVALCNGHGNGEFVAQHAVALLLAVANRLLLHHDRLAHGGWPLREDEAKSLPLRDRVVGVAGAGAIGARVARMLRGFRCPVYAISRHGAPGGRFDRVYRRDDKAEFLAAVDTLVMCLPSTPETAGWLGEEEIALLGEGGLVVNVGRGDAVDETALHAALVEGRLAGAGLDVFAREQDPVEDAGGKWPYAAPFHVLPNVVLSPHRAASPFDDLARWEDVIHNVRVACRGGDGLVNRVDLSLGY